MAMPSARAKQVEEASRLERIIPFAMLKELMKEDAENVKWLYDVYKDLLKGYKNTYVAIRKQQVIDHDKNVQELITRLESKFPKTDDILIYYVAPQKIKFLF